MYLETKYYNQVKLCETDKICKAHTYTHTRTHKSVLLEKICNTGKKCQINLKKVIKQQNMLSKVLKFQESEKCQNCKQGYISPQRY